MSAPHYRKTTFLFFGALILALLPWFYIQSQLIFNGNILFLTQSAIHLISGEKMSEAYYDTNPPLSIIIYAVPAYLTKYGGLDISSSLVIWSLFFLTFSAVLLGQNTKSLPHLHPFHRNIIVATFIILNTISLCLFFGEKEFFIITALTPFVFLQMAMYEEQKVGVISKHLTLMIGAFFLMVKPHYYIVPGFMIFLRLLKQRRISTLWDSDCVYICGFVVAYLLSLYVFFPDFLTIILPDILTLYLANPLGLDTKITVYAIFVSGGLIAASTLIKAPTYKYVNMLFASAALSVLAYYIQGMGYFYHLTPFIVFMTIGGMLMIQDFISVLLGFIKIPKPISLMIAATLICSGLLYGSYARHNQDETMSHQKFKTLPLTELLKRNCIKKPCSFFMLNDNVEIIQQLSLYTAQDHASRFPVFWFMPRIVSKNEPMGVSVGKEDLFLKYSNFVAEDMRRYKPQTLLIQRLDLNDANPNFDTIAFFKQNEKFAQEMKNYSLMGTIEIDQRDYAQTQIFDGKSYPYDIYIRQEINYDRP